MATGFEQALLNVATRAALKQAAARNVAQKQMTNAVNTAKANAMDAMAMRTAAQQGAVKQNMQQSGLATQQVNKAPRAQGNGMQQASRANMPMLQQMQPSRRF